MRSRLTVALGRTARALARLRGGGSGGTAFPGLVMERTDPGFLARTLDRLPHGVVLVSGTNGKTTTTKMVVQLLRDQGLKVFTNRTGSNFVRGVLAALLTEVDAVGRLDADVAVLELDEAHAVHFVHAVKPRAALVLNVMRDQLDRFGEIDYTASLLRKAALATRDVVVVNADDPRLNGGRFLDGLTARTAAFGVGPALRSVFLSDDDLRAEQAAMPDDDAPISRVSPADAASPCPPPRVRLVALNGNQATIEVDGAEHRVAFAIPGIHNVLNACAALTLALEVLGERADLPRLLATLSEIRPAFGRGEVITLDGRPVQLALVKNPAGFRMSLMSAPTAQVGTADRGRPGDAATAPAASPTPTGADAPSPADELIMVAINDEYADGRDMSWLWDVDFSSLKRSGVAVVTGVRAWDMALRLRYDEVPVGVVEPDLEAGLDALRERAAAEDRPMRVYTTYTAMLALRARLGRLTEVEEVMK
ncbi:UDP-N-acetylmuramyl tripeptide synthase [Actinomyces ruminicola]|uniref:Lipid II isoglutaminyl synthase (glutamine-hydrolyzing) subunit MurT n=1 Tax=Actinomyces ruminicola TaxID=332524 RepID=A0A1H0AVT2_9ACTO|nr:Mur ligase family protein [Actinomyces ruminicola]SDN37316.1 UDP-N-acetylmuramyl tripeptide synthase [Actinomyces ruminicola]